MYTTLLTSGKLNSYLADIDEQAREMFFRLVEQMADREGVTEQFKATDQMAWVGAMNNIRNRAMEVVNQSMIYTDSLFNSRQFHAEYEEPPKVFWKYYDLYRRKKISLSEYAANTGLSTVVLEYYLKNIVQMEPRVIENPKQI